MIQDSHNSYEGSLRCMELWETLVDNPNAIQMDQDSIFVWFTECLSDLEPETQKELLNQKLLCLPPNLTTEKSFSCLKAYFESVNPNESTMNTLKKKFEDMEKAKAEMTNAMQCAANNHRLEIESLKKNTEGAIGEELTRTRRELEAANQSNKAKATEIETLKSHITQKEEEQGKEKNTVRKFKSIARKIRKQKEEAEKKGVALEEEKKKLEADNEKLKTENEKLQEISVLKEERAKSVLETARAKIQRSGDENKKLELELDQLKIQNASLKKDIEEQHKVLKEKTEQITVLETCAEKLRNEKSVLQKYQQNITTRTQTLEREKTTLKSDRNELQEKVSEAMKEKSQMRSKQRMHFAMVDAGLDNIIQETETPESVKSSLKVLKRCSQQFLNEDAEIEEPPKKIAKIESTPLKTETPCIKNDPKQEYMEQVEDIQMKVEKEEIEGND